MAGHRWSTESRTRKSGKPRQHYVRARPPENGAYVAPEPREPPPIKLAYLAFLDTTDKPEHLK